MKIFTDGSLIGRTAAMSDRYEGEPGNSGYLQADAAQLTATIVAAHRAGWRVAAHAIGDRAIDLALDALAAAAAGHPRTNPRHRIEHFAASRPDQVISVDNEGGGCPPRTLRHRVGDAMMAAVGPGGIMALPRAVAAQCRTVLPGVRTARWRRARRCSASTTWSTGAPPPAPRRRW